LKIKKIKRVTFDANWSGQAFVWTEFEPFTMRFSPFNPVSMPWRYSIGSFLTAMG